jgi:hypothetical protein
MAFFYTPKKSAISSLQKKKRVRHIFDFIFPLGWNPVWLASRFALLPAIIFSPMLFDCCV